MVIRPLLAPNSRERLTVFGGTFTPPGIGHPDLSHQITFISGIGKYNGAQYLSILQRDSNNLSPVFVTPFFSRTFRSKIVVIFASDQYSQVKFVSHTLNTDSTGPCVRMSAAASGVCWIADSAKIYVLTAGSGVRSVVTCPLPASGDTLQLSVVGSTYTCTDVTTGLYASGTDTTYFSGSPGILVDQRPSTSYALAQFQSDCLPSCGVTSMLTAAPTFSLTGKTSNPAQM